MSVKIKRGRAATEAFAKRLEQALGRHRAGRLDEAEKLYKQALALQPDDPDALHYLGVVTHQRGDHDKAVELIERAVARRPEAAQMFCNLAEARREAGKPVE